MGKIRGIKQILGSIPTIEGAGVKLKRAFGYPHTNLLDPFLLLDNFHSNNPPDYINGFPWHPHRGIETITYVLHGEVEHKDSIGNKGNITSGDVQWMTAGNGIIHQEMPIEQKDGILHGFQLWANLPSSHKMIDPRYRDIINKQIPEIEIENGTKIKIISGKINGEKGPVSDIIITPEYLDITIPLKTKFTHKVTKGHTIFAYVINGSGYFYPENLSKENKTENTNDSYLNKNSFAQSEDLVIFEDGDEIEISTNNELLRILLISGKPIREPIAWAGPIVMNTQKELTKAFEDYQNGTFIKNPITNY